MTTSRLKHCPNCAAALEADDAAVGIFDERSGDGGYDVYCESCGWSGDVFPDAEQGARAGATSTARVAVIAERVPADFSRDLYGPRTRRR